MSSIAELIEVLESFHPDRTAAVGFQDPHSYRGFYDQLAVKPAYDVTVADMLAALREADGTTYEGWKGGEYTMDSYTDVWLANRGDVGIELSDVLLRLMLTADRTTLLAALGPLIRLRWP